MVRDRCFRKESIPDQEIRVEHTVCSIGDREKTMHARSDRASELESAEIGVGALGDARPPAVAEREMQKKLMLDVGALLTPDFLAHCCVHEGAAQYFIDLMMNAKRRVQTAFQKG